MTCSGRHIYTATIADGPSGPFFIGGKMGKVAQVRTSDNTCGTYQRPSRREVARMLSCGHSPASISSCYGMSLRDVRRIAKRVSE